LDSSIHKTKQQENQMKLRNLIGVLLSMTKGRKPEEIKPGHFVFHPDQTTQQEINSIPEPSKKNTLLRVGEPYECKVILLQDRRLAIIPNHLQGQPWAKEALKMAA
jgi:hypothetical protein